MVKGLDSFRSYFAGFEDCYVLIGGTACDLNFASAALPFRATRDLDIVLCVEAFTPDFSRQFWRFVAEGGYERREKSSGNRRFYRFSHPLNADFPMLLELFSRKPDFIPEDYDGIIAPIPMGEEASTPPTSSSDLEDFMEMQEIREAVRIGDEQIACGETIPHEQVMREMDAMLDEMEHAQ